MFRLRKCSWRIASGLISILLSVSAAFAEKTPVTECDMLAAQPFDPHRVTDGILFEHVDAPTAIQECRRAMEQFPASPRLIYQLGRAYDANKELAQAVKWYREAAERGYAAAQGSLGLMYGSGEGVEQNDSEAFKWFHLAADQGYSVAQSQMGRFYFNGLGVKQDSVKAAMWFRRAAQQGYPEAQANLGWMYLNGEGVEVDFTEAVKSYRHAAENGYADAAYYLGTLFQVGKYVPSDREEAKRWYLRAAEQGHSKAQYKLGTMNIDETVIFGLPGDSDFPEAIKWFRLSANQGNGDAQYMLGSISFFGIGIPKNNIEARMWYSLAEKSGNELGRLGREDSEKKMTSEEVNKSEAMAKKWLEKHQSQ